MQVVGATEARGISFSSLLTHEREKLSHGRKSIYQATRNDADGSVLKQKAAVFTHSKQRAPLLRTQYKQQDASPL